MAADFLYNGMKKGTIESLPEYWRQLAQLYQYDNKELQAISVLKEAAQLFPKDGNFEFQMGQLYGSIDKPKDARDAYARAIQKGNLEKPHQAYLFLAYTQLELKDYETALKTINQALAMPEGAKDPQVKTLKDGIELTIAEAKAAQEAREAAAKKL
jgi:tetratricopeptide (TPR) repeat protein